MFDSEGGRGRVGFVAKETSATAADAMKKPGIEAVLAAVVAWNCLDEVV